MATESPIKSTDEPTIGRLIKDAQTDFSTLMRKEIQLAKSELKVSVTAGGFGVVYLCAALFTLTLAIIMLSVAFAYLINWNGDGLDLHWAFLIVFAFYTLVSVILVLVGIRSFKKVKAPERAIEQGKGIPRALKGQV